VIPTAGRPSLATLLAALAPARAYRRPVEIVIVDDRPGPGPPLPVPPALRGLARTAATGGGGPAAARNAGWRAARHDWVAFLDDDVIPDPDWLDRLDTDLAAAGDDVGGVQGRVRVPLPADRPPTDWERTTHRLAGGRWITADMAYRRAALASAGGFDERFRRAYREDAELAHRVVRAGWRLVAGGRRVIHPIRPEPWWVSLRAQRGNADDAMLRRIYGAGWRRRLGIPAGRRPVHLAATAAGGTALLLGVVAAATHGRGRTVAHAAAAAAGAGWLAVTAQYALARIAPGPCQAGEVAAMLVTSAAIPPVATGWWLRGWWRGRGARAVPGGGRLPGHSAPALPAPPAG
jgi:hypothetical protein